MAIELVMPKLGLSMTEGKIVKWLKKKGDAVKKNEDVLEIETEKLATTVPAPVDGILIKILFEEGTVVPIAHPIGYIGKTGEKIPDAEREFKESNEKTVATEKTEEVTDKSWKRIA